MAGSEQIRAESVGVPAETGSQGAEALSLVLHYDVAMEDVLRFQLHGMYHNRAMRRQFQFARWSIPMMMTGFAILGVVTTAAGHDALGWICFCMLFGGVWLFATPIVHQRLQLRLVRRIYAQGKNRFIFGKHTLSLTPEFITYLSEVSEFKVRWVAVESVEVTNEDVFIYIGAIQSLIVPRRAFADDAARREFLETLDRYRDCP